MAGWLDWFEEEIDCPNCGEKIIVLFCEDGNPKREPVVFTGFAGENKCTACGKEIKDKDLNSLG